MATAFGPVPNTPIRDNPTEDSIWKRWFTQLRAQYNSAGFLEHNDLAGLQGGTTDEYYHLTALQSAALANVGALTEGSVLFAGVSGVISQDNTNFVWDNTNNQLSLSATGSGAGLLVGGDVQWYRDTANVWRTPDSVIIDTNNAVVGGLNVGRTTSTTIGNANKVQVTGTTAATSSLGISAWIAGAGGAGIEFGKSRGAAIGTNTIVQSGDALGAITAYGADGTNFDTAARISFEVDGTPGAGTDMPGRIVFLTSPDGSATLTEALRIDQARLATFAGAVTIAGAVTLSTFTLGSVLFAGTSGLVSQDNANLFWDNSANRLGIGNAAPSVTLDVTGSLAVSGNSTLGDAVGDTLTINAGTWTIGSNYTATRAAGALAAGTNQLQTWANTWSGDAGGTSTANIFRITSTGSGVNAANNFRNLQVIPVWGGSATLTLLEAAQISASVSSTGDATSVRGVSTFLTWSGAGNTTTADYFLASAPTLSSTGAVTNMNGFHCASMGDNTLVTNAIQFQADNSNQAVTLTAGFRSQMNSGTGKWAFLASGSANSAFNGNVRIGSTTAPTVALDVTGAALISTTLGVTGNVTATADLAVNGGDITTSATTFNLLNATATTLNIGGAATTVAIGALTGTTTINNDLAVGDQISAINGVTSSGNFGVPVVVASGRSTAQTAAVASVSTFTVGGSDGSFQISANVNVTTSTVHDITVTCAYTDEGNTARTFTFGFAQLAGATLITNITNVTGAGPYESPVYHIRAKSGTAITIATTGTFTTVTYNVEGIVKQVN